MPGSTNVPVQVVWFKRDLRVFDHEPLVRAAALGPVLPLFVVEPELCCAPEADRGFFGFQLESLRELARALAARGAPLLVRRGAAVEVFARLDDELRALGGIAHVHSYQESGNALTYARDRAVRRLLRTLDVPWTEYHQHGVVRRLESRDGWARLWQERMQRPVLQAPVRLETVPEVAGLASNLPPLDQLALDDLGLPPSNIVARQRGGESEARALLRSFLAERAEPYQKAMSSPVTGEWACSRLSPHFAHGTISLKVVYQALQRRLAELRTLPPARRSGFGASLRSFAGRLRWHCHFVQKLEQEPAIEFENMHRGFDGMREHDLDEARLRAFEAGRTGVPMVDACMRYLCHTGWLNFRMRAMLVSFAAYPLWLHWRPVGIWLARHFVDFEPGIHWSQMQMQSGTTGINTVRIYSPAKQLRDQDPDGSFVRRFVPELQHVPLAHLAEPFRMTRAEQDAAHCRIGRDYPAPIVDVDQAIAAAKQRIFARRRAPAVRAESRVVLQQHGSRKRPTRRSRS